MAAGVAEALLNKHSTPVVLSPSSPRPSPSHINTLFHTDTQSLPYGKTTTFFAWLTVLCSLWQRIRNEKWASFVPLTSHYYPVLSTYRLKLPWLHACALHLSLCPKTPVCVSVCYFHWLVFEGLICFSPAIERLFPPLPSPSSCTSNLSSDFLIVVTGRFSSELLKQTCVTLTITSWRSLSAQNVKVATQGRFPVAVSSISKS